MNRIVVFACLAVAMFFASASPAAITGPVRTDTGLLQGTVGTDPSISVFKGIPYAAPPSGQLRWRPPQPAAHWQGVRSAEQQAAVCPTGGRGKPGQTQSEDCLFVNLWTGASKAGEKRAVMVWFHGAGDNTADAVFDGENLAKKGVVVVTVEYRVGVLAGLATRELSQESGHNASSNYGLMDDVAALQWIKRNIGAFGGDPANVTLFGQSHGAGTQHFLAMSPLTKGLFHRVIMQSHAKYPKDPVLFQVALDYKLLPVAEASGAAYMDKLGVHSLKELRETPLEKLLATPAYGSDHVVDGYFLPRNFTETYARGSQVNAFVIAGFNKDETGASPETNYTRFAERAASRGAGPGAAPPAGGERPNPPTNVSGLAAYLAAAHQKYGALAEEYLQLYPASNDHEAFTATNNATRDNARVSLWMWAGAWRQKATQPVYLYFWTHAPPGRNHDFTGAYHGSEISFAYNHPRAPDELQWSDEDRRIGEVMSSYWTNFAKTGNPNGKGLPKWEPYSGKSERVMELGDQFHAIPLADRAKVDFWKRFYETQPAG